MEWYEWVLLAIGIIIALPLLAAYIYGLVEYQIIYSGDVGSREW